MCKTPLKISIGLRPCGCTKSLFKLFFFAPVAQLVEHLTLNQGVQGSSPCGCTAREASHQGLLLFFFILTFYIIVMQLCTPRLVAIAVSIAASVCKINFHVSFFIAFKIIRLKIFSFCSFFRPQISLITLILLSITAAKPRLFLISQIACAANRNFSCCNRNQIPS